MTTHVIPVAERADALSAGDPDLVAYIANTAATQVVDGFKAEIDRLTKVLEGVAARYPPPPL